MNPWGSAGFNPLGLSADQMTRIQQLVTKWQAELTPDLDRVQTEKHGAGAHDDGSELRPVGCLGEDERDRQFAG